MHVNKTSSIFIIAHYIQGLQYRLLKIFFRERRKGITFKSLSKQCITSDKKHSSSSNFCIINLYHFCVVHDLVLNIIIEKSLGSEMLWITFRYSWHFPNRKKRPNQFRVFCSLAHNSNLVRIEVSGCTKRDAMRWRRKNLLSPQPKILL